MAQGPQYLQDIVAKSEPPIEVGASIALLFAAPFYIDPLYKQMADDEFNFIVTGNAAKWKFIHDSEGCDPLVHFDWTKVDDARDFALNATPPKGMRGHVLIFHRAVPSWLWNSSNLKTELECHIENVVGRYQGDVSEWCVVNEVVSDIADSSVGYFNASDDLRGDGIWANNYPTPGEQYIIDAFNAAAAADPGAKLAYNDYGIERWVPGGGGRRAVPMRCWNIC